MTNITVINDLDTAKLILRNPKILTPEMCIRIGQAITSAITMLKEQEEQIKDSDESLEKAREEIKWLRGMLNHYTDRRPAYICDPEKNTSCTKEGCMIFQCCRCTTNKEFAKTGENNKPIVAVRSDL